MSDRYPVHPLDVDGFYVRDCALAFRVDEGGVSEGESFVIKLGARIETIGAQGEQPCRHAEDVATAPFKYREGPGEVEYQKTIWVVPRLLEATNEGGHACTQVCLDCAIEASGQIRRDGEIEG